MTPAEVDTERAQAAQGDSDGSMRLRAESPSDSPGRRPLSGLGR